MTHFVEDVPDVGLRFTEPHGEKFGSLDGDEVGLALVGDSFSQERFTATGRTVEEDTAGRLHTEFEELFGMFHGILDQLLQLSLDILEASDVAPADVRGFDDLRNEIVLIRFLTLTSF